MERTTLTAPEAAPLREDISLSPGPRRGDGSPGWVLYDPAANVFYEIGWREFEILSRWHLASPAAMAEAVCEETTLTVGPADVGRLIAFLADHGLLRLPSAKLLAIADRSRRTGAMGWLSGAFGDLLFRKIPLISPDPFLRRTAPWVRPLFGSKFLCLVGVALLLAMYLVGRQWGQFVAGFDRLYSLEGAAGVAISLTIAKSVHELSHAYVARLNGVEVPSMGVSLILFWPVLYTETSAAWRLPDRAKRLRIAAAGVGSELVLAVLALLAWPFLDPGWTRNTVQFAASSLVVLSVAVNANPLMRFDGYFVVCDLTGMENLQPRSLSLLAWAFRRLMAGSPEPSPEPGLSGRVRAALMVFGGALGLYRVSLYSGIAYGLTALVFPALGVGLALLVIVLFLGYPVAQQVGRWFRSASKRLGPVLGPIRVMVVLALLAAPLVIPWRASLMVPVLIRFGEAHAVFAPEAAEIVRVWVTYGQRVAVGQALVELASPDLTHQLVADRLKANRLSVLLDQHLTQTAYREDEHVEEEEILRLRSEIVGLEARLAKLTLRAGVEGIVRDLETGLTAGRWVAEDRPLLRVVSEGRPSAEAYVEERDLYLLVPGAEGTLWLEGKPFASIPIRLRGVFDQAVPRIEAGILAGPGGGPIQVKQAADRSWAPETAIYKAELELLEPSPDGGHQGIETRGFADIDTPPRNLIGRIWDRIVGVWRREIG